MSAAQSELKLGSKGAIAPAPMVAMAWLPCSRTKCAELACQAISKLTSANKKTKHMPFLTNQILCQSPDIGP